MSASLVQSAAGAAIATSVTVTLPSPTTPGNCLIALIGDSADTTNGTPAGVTLGGAADNWTQAAIHSAGAHAVVAGWVDPGCAGNQTSVTVTWTGGTGDRLFAWVYEWAGLTGAVDVSSGGDNGFASAWTSGVTGITAQPSEVAFGITCGASNGTPGLAGAGFPWVYQAQQTLTGALHSKCALPGYQILSAAGTVEYAGTAAPTNTNDTVVFTLIAVAVPAPASSVIPAFAVAM